MNRYYTLYNQKVKSELEIPEAIPIERPESIDITIELGKPPQWVLDAAKNGQVDFIEEQIMWFYLEKLVLFYVENGNHIIIYRESQDITDLSICSYLTGSAFTLALMQKQYIPVHGGTVAYQNKGIIISGASGSGKSTITMALRQRGLIFVSDDVSAIYQSKETLKVLPGFPQQKICRDAIAQFNLKEEELIYIDEDRDKFAWRFRQDYCDQPLPIACMIEIVASKTEKQVKYSETKGSEKLRQLMNNIYRGEVYQRLKTTPERLTMFIELASKIPMYQVIRPLGVNTVEEVVDCICEQILQSC